MKITLTIQEKVPSEDDQTGAAKQYSNNGVKVGNNKKVLI